MCSENQDTFYNNTVNTKREFSQWEFDRAIGKLDRALSEFLLLPPTDEANRQTLKHHADDLIGVGTSMLKKLSN